MAGFVGASLPDISLLLTTMQFWPGAFRSSVPSSCLFLREQHQGSLADMSTLRGILVKTDRPNLEAVGEYWSLLALAR